MPTKAQDSKKLTKAEKRKYEQLVDELEDVDLATFAWTRWKAQTDTYYLGTQVLKLFDSPKGRKRLDPKFHSMMCEYLDREEDTMIIVPRDHLKTTWVRVWCVRQILKDLNARVAYFTKTTRLAWSGIQIMKSWLQRPVLLQLFMELNIPKSKWILDQKDQFTIIRDEDAGFVPAEAAVTAWGVDSSFTGTHTDYHMYDDIIDKESVRTAAKLRKTDEWWSIVQPMKEPTAVDKYVGTPYHYQDITARIIAEKLYDRKNILWVPVETNGKFAYSFFNKKLLEKKKKSMTPYDFAANYYLDTRPKEDRFFVPPYPIYTPEQFPQNPEYYIALDPAPTAGVYSDQNGFVIGAVDKQMPTRVFCKEAFGVKKEPSEIASLLVQKIVQYKPLRVGIEYGLQTALQGLIDVKLDEEQHKRKGIYRPEFVAIPMKQGSDRKPDRLYRTIAAFIRDSRFLLPATSEGKYDPSVDRLIEQMDFYNPNSEKNDDDVIDAASMIIQTIEHFSAGHWYKAGGYQPPQLFTWEWHKKRQDKKKKKGAWGYKFAS